MVVVRLWFEEADRGERGDSDTNSRYGDYLKIIYPQNHTQTH